MWKCGGQGDRPVSGAIQGVNHKSKFTMTKVPSSNTVQDPNWSCVGNRVAKQRQVILWSNFTVLLFPSCQHEAFSKFLSPTWKGMVLFKKMLSDNCNKRRYSS